MIPAPPPAIAAPAAFLGPAAFRDRLAAAIRAAGGAVTGIVDDATFRARTAAGTEVAVSIDNAYAAYRAQPDAVEQIVARYARVLLASEEAGSETVDRLIEIVHPNDYLKRSLPAGASLDSFPAGARSAATYRPSSPSTPTSRSAPPPRPIWPDGS